MLEETEAVSVEVNNDAVEYKVIYRFLSNFHPSSTYERQRAPLRFSLLQESQEDFLFTEKEEVHEHLLREKEKKRLLAVTVPSSVEVTFLSPREKKFHFPGSK